MIWLSIGLALTSVGSLLFGYRWGWTDARQKATPEHRPPAVSAWTMLAPGLMFAGTYLIATNLP